MHWRRFLLYNALGGILWAALIGGTAYALGAAVHQVNSVVSIMGAIIAGLVVVVGLVWSRGRIRRLEVLAEAAFPGPLDGAPGSDGSSSSPSPPSDPPDPR